jgi:hypothetical protein
MKLTYWYAERLDDSNVYSVRARTRREAKAHIAEYDHADYGPIVKVTVEYDNAFDLMAQCTGEGGLWQEPDACP